MSNYFEFALPFSPLPTPHVLLATRVLMCLGGLALLGLIALRPALLSGRVRAFVVAPASPFGLGLLRFVVFFAVFGVSVTRPDLMLTSPLRPDHPVRAPYPMPFELPESFAFPVPPMAVCQKITLALRIACALAAVGAGTPWTCGIATALAFYIFGVSQSYGFISHVHHLVALAVLLSLSPCGDAFSIDAWVRARRGARAPDTPRLCYGVPLRMASLILAVVMFFPGFWKLWTSGVEWTTAENMRNILHDAWAVHGTPSWRVDRAPWLCALAASSTVALELALVPLLLLGSPRVRAASGGLVFLFLASVVVLLGIPFWHLALCFIAFVDWDRLRPGRGASPEERAPAVCDPLPRAVLVAGSVLLLGFGCCGALRMAIWPFAAYPPYDRLYSPVRVGVRVSIRTPDGQVQPVDPAVIVYPHWWHLADCLVSMPPEQRLARAAEMAPWLRSRGVVIAPTDALEFYQEIVWTDPDRAEAPALSRTLLLSRPAGP